MQSSAMKTTTFATLDGNKAVARVTYALNKVIAIYPITPATPMGKWADALTARNENVGVIKARLYRPFDSARFVAALPKKVKATSVLDRSKEPGSAGEPMCLDLLSAIVEQSNEQSLTATPKVLPVVVGGRYGLSSKELTPTIVEAVFDNLLLDGFQDNVIRPKNHFTVGINDDVTHTSLAYDPDFSIESAEMIQKVFYGLGADGTTVDSRSPKLPVEVSMYAENRFKILSHAHPQQARALLEQAQQDVNARWQKYQSLANTEPKKRMNNDEKT